MSEENPNTIIEANNLEKHFNMSSGLVNRLFGRSTMLQAVDGVSLKLDSHDSIAIIGESGCGKSTLLNTLIGMHEPTSGEIYYKGTNVEVLTKEQISDFYRRVQMIFQDPFNSLDPKQNVRSVLTESLEIHGIGDVDRRIREVLADVELQPYEKYIDKRPHELSGGEKQRVSIARALIVDPDILLADEPLSMLDVSTQASILNLLNRLVHDSDMSLLYVSHDISTVSHICDDIMVMYLGRVIERASTMELLKNPKHPYTQALIQSIPIPDPHNKRERVNLKGSPSDPIELGDGCRFRDRCPERMDICDITPEFRDISDNHGTSCHLYYDHYNEPIEYIEQDMITEGSES